MTAQLLPNLVYALMLVIVLLSPYASIAFPSSDNRKSARDELILRAIMALALVLAAARHGGFTLWSLALLLPLFGLGLRALLGGVAAVLLFAPAMWWQFPRDIGAIAAIIFVLLGLGAAALPRLGATSRPADAGAIGGSKILLPMFACLLIGLAMGLPTAPYRSAEPIYTAWHHWGAFISPVDAWLSGGLPYRDFPVQYGLGPTTLLAATCGQDCWRTMYWTAIVANALYFATLAGGALILTQRSSRGLRWLGLIALFCAAYLWTAFPISVGATSMTPSVAGLRFSPISALLLHILVAERDGARRDWIGHMIWLADLFWSPEAAFFGTLIWWPYLALRDAGAATTWREAVLALARGALRGALALLAGLVVLGLIVWLLAGRALMLGDFLAYIQHPPGMLPINLIGAVWLVLAVIALATHSLATTGRSGQTGLAQTRSLYACLLGFLAAGTYFLSRSHDNNILNLFPLLVLVLLAILANDERDEVPEPTYAPRFARTFIQTILAAMIAFVATFNYTPWIDGAARNGARDVGPGHLLAQFAPKNGAAPALPDDAVAGLTYLRSRGADAVVLLDERRIMPRAVPGAGWTGVNNAANFIPLPDAMIVKYVKAGARAYHRPGWLLVENAGYGHWLALFETAYVVREQHRFGAYSAYYLVPRQTAPRDDSARAGAFHDDR